MDVIVNGNLKYNYWLLTINGSYLDDKKTGVNGLLYYTCFACQISRQYLVNRAYIRLAKVLLVLLEPRRY